MAADINKIGIVQIGSTNVGIGTTTPFSQLEISQNSTVAGATFGLERVDASVTAGNAIGIISFLGGEDGTSEQVAAIIAQADEAWAASSSGSRLIFRTTTSGNTNDTERMRINSSGDVDIGTNQLLMGSAIATNDVGLVRNAAGVVRLSDGSTGIGEFLTAKLVEANTAVAAGPNVITATESESVFTNEGATAENHHDLPTAVAGLRYTFIVQDADGIQINAATGDTIRIGATVSASAGFISSTTIGDFVVLQAINATEWIALNAVQGWTFDT